MSVYEIETPEDVEGGHRVSCSEHGESQEFPAGHARGSFYCSECDVEIEVVIEDASNWRELTEWC